MIITKSTSLTKMNDVIELLTKLKKDKEIKTINFSGNYNIETKVENFNVNWSVNEAL